MNISPAKFHTLALAGVWILGVLSWATAFLLPLDWPVSSMTDRSALIPIGPVSEFVVPGQLFGTPEAVSAIDVLIRVGGPFGASTPVGMAVYEDVERTSLVARSGAEPVSVPAGLAVIRFDLDVAIDGNRRFYLELEIPPDNPWPIFVGGTRDDPRRAGDYLYLERRPGWSDQDLAYQFFRRQTGIQRFIHIASVRPEMAWTIVLSLVAVLGMSAGLSLLALRNYGWMTISGAAVALPGLALLALLVWLLL
jgi:hypothetical protein